MKSNEISDEYFVSISFEIGELFLLLFNQILEENDEHLDYLKGFLFFFGSQQFVSRIRLADDVRLVRPSIVVAHNFEYRFHIV